MGLFSRKRSQVADDLDEDEVEAVEPEGADPEDDEIEAIEVVAEDETETAPADDPATDVEDEEVEAEAATEDEGDAEGEVEGEDEGDAEGEVDTGQVEFELADWGARERQMLDSELAAARVRRAWEGPTLVVRSSDADVVDDLIDDIEERIALDLAPDVVPVTYEVGDWPEGLEERLLEVLIEERIAHMRGYREITVGIDDEERVDDLVEKVTAAWEEEQPTGDELDGPDAQEVLSELFVSSDRLLHDPSDRPATVRFDDAAESALGMGLPFGFDEALWASITGLVGALRDKLVEVDSTDDEIIEAATALRSELRPLV